MPIYEFKCPKCGKVVAELLSYDQGMYCIPCDAPMEKLMSGFAFNGSEKSWYSRKEVNFDVDDSQKVYNKQLAITANKEKPQNLTTKQWHNILAHHKREASNTRPIRARDEIKHGLNTGGSYVEVK